ncbi:GTPase-activating protein gyp8 [Tilletia horrida]|uniref:GTPase-activating protein gyp8 n=1 Tax=Tilletia horrida TaxID=155126 RepID=A0AAN6JP09_9BASI|nr:GTPase-activating protein gyp8 [Tilletia horrida]KAK0539565.1 GTPase-activating protein gyp8 [Tilletia horrida]
MQDLDIERLRTAAVSPQGLGSPEERQQLWYILLGVQPPQVGARTNAYKTEERRDSSPGPPFTSPTATTSSNESRLSLHDARSSIPAIQFGSFQVGSDTSSAYTESLGEPESTLGSESVTTESQHALPLGHEQLKPPSFAHAHVSAAAADEWQTVSKRRRAGSRTNSQVGHSDGTDSAAPLSPVAKDDAQDPRAQASQTSASSTTGSTPAATTGTLSTSRSVNRFDALRGSPAGKSSTSQSPARVRKQSQAAKRSRAASIAQSLSSSDAHLNGSEAALGQSADAISQAVKARSHVAQQPKRSVDRIVELLQKADSLSPRDAQQVELDVNRSFLSFRKGSLKDATVLAARRRQLFSLCIGVLQRRKALSYYQGYHDVLTVLLLTLLPDTKTPDSFTAIPSIPPELHLAAERLSLHWLRDAMTRNLDAAMGHLRLLRNLLRETDPEMATVVERAFPLPYFALPWLITLLTHSLPNLALAQRVLDFVLIYGPMSALYLCVTIIRLNKESVAAIASDSSDADEMDTEIRIHQALAALPSFKLDDEAAGLLGEEDDDSEPGGDDQFADAVGDDSLYDDPDVFGPADSSANGFGSPNSNGSATSESKRKHGSKTLQARGDPAALPISRLLRQAADLMAQHEEQLRESKYGGIMGPGSVLETWPATVASRRVSGSPNGRSGETRRQLAAVQDDALWDEADDRAEYIIRVDSGDVQADGPESADNLVIVHPELPEEVEPLEEGPGGDTFEEKITEKTRRPRTRTRTTSVWASHKGDPSSLTAKTTITLAALGVAGVVLSMYANASMGDVVAAGAGDRAEQMRAVLGAVGKLLSLTH